MQVLLYGLGGPEVVTDFLVFFVFLESIFVLDRFEFFLFDLKHAVEINQAFLLLFQFDLLHQLDALFTGVESFRIENFNTVDLQLGFVVVVMLKGCTGSGKLFTRFLFDAVTTSCQ